MNRTSIYLVFILSFVFAFFAQGQQVENPGFEDWEEYGYGPDTLEPVNWNSLRTSDGGDLINAVIPVTLERSSDAHSGDYSVKLENDTILGMVAPGTMTNGRVHATLPPSDAYVFTIDSMPEFHTPFTDMPDSLTFWAKFFPQNNDIARIIAILHTDTAKIADPLQTNWVAVANIGIDTEVTDWSRFSIPFTYLNDDTPEYILFAIYAGDAANSLLGSILYLDDLELIYFNTSIADTEEQDVDVYFSGNNLVVGLETNKPIADSKLDIVNLSGRILYSTQISSNISTIQIDIPAGVYICRIQNASMNFTKKLVKK